MKASSPLVEGIDNKVILKNRQHKYFRSGRVLDPGGRGGHTGWLPRGNCVTILTESLFKGICLLEVYQMGVILRRRRKIFHVFGSIILNNLDLRF